MPAPGSVRADSTVQPLVPATQPPKNTLPASSTVLVSAGQTLCSISMQRFGSCTPGLLQQILRFNPSVTDPDVIQEGQTLRMPVDYDGLDDTQSSTKQPDPSSFAKRGTQ
jgi:hypothetical protein